MTTDTQRINELGHVTVKLNSFQKLLSRGTIVFSANEQIYEEALSGHPMESFTIRF